MLRPKHLLILKEVERSGGAEREGVRLCFELLAVADAIDRDCAARLAPHGLSEARFVVLVALYQSANRGSAPSQIAALAGVTRGTATGLIDGLERDGLAERAPDPTDGRGLVVRLTRRGRRLVDELSAQHVRWISGLLRNLAPGERQTLGRLLGRVWAATADGGASAAPAHEAVRTPE
jgi:DNA-binding MarR family transcriptional regulator